MYTLRKGHHLSTEMNLVHKKMESTYNLQAEANKDIATAKKMEQYLRAFKYAGDNFRKDTQKPSFQVGLEYSAMSQIADQVAQRLGLGQQQGNSLFRWTHQMGFNQAKAVGADDIFEAELANLLQVAANEATSGTTSNKNTGVEMVGNIAANISKEFLQEFQIQGQGIINKTSKHSDFVSTPTFKSGKVDVKGYSGDFVVEATINPQWEDFIQTFSNAKMTLKNYSSGKTEVIHLGNTNPSKAILGSLKSLDYGAKEATHIYYHLTGGRKKFTGSPKEGHHIIHLRFAYELTGGGLYDSKNNRLDAADFFVYNDPTSGNIWVRSTKAMIAEISKYSGHVADPLHSQIVVLKNSFQ